MKPTKKTNFLPFSEIENYTDKDKYFCQAIVFSPDTENDHFYGCPPYIAISSIEIFPDEDKVYFFEVPEIIAYYGTVHAGYTMRGKDNARLQGEKNFADKFKKLLEIK